MYLHIKTKRHNLQKFSMLCRRRKKNYIEAAARFRNCLSGPLSCLVVLLFILDICLDSPQYPYPYLYLDLDSYLGANPYQDPYPYPNPWLQFTTTPVQNTAGFTYNFGAFSLAFENGGVV